MRNEAGDGGESGLVALASSVRFEASVETRVFRSSQGVVTGEAPGRWEARAQVRGVGRRGRRERLA